MEKYDDFCIVLSIREMFETAKVALVKPPLEVASVEQAKVCWWRREDVLERKRRAWDLLESLMRRCWKRKGAKGRGPCSIWRTRVIGVLPTGMVWLLSNPLDLQLRMCLPSTTDLCSTSICFICLLLQMCSSSQSVLKYSVYYLCLFFYALHKFSVMLGFFFPTYLKKYPLIASAGIKILKPPERAFVFLYKPNCGSCW